MEQRGIFSFTLAIVFFLSLFSLQGAQQSMQKKFLEAKNTAIELEQANLFRSLLEENFDDLVSEGLKIEALKGNTDSAALKLALDAKAFSFFQKLEGEPNNAEIAFFSAETSERNYKALPKNPSKKSLSAQDIAESTKAIAINLGNSNWQLEYSFNGGLLKNKVVFAEAKLPNNQAVFVVPIDYTVSLEVKTA